MTISSISRPSSTPPAVRSTAPSTLIAGGLPATSSRSLPRRCTTSASIDSSGTTLSLLRAAPPDSLSSEMSAFRSSSIMAVPRRWRWAARQRRPETERSTSSAAPNDHSSTAAKSRRPATVGSTHVGGTAGRHVVSRHGSTKKRTKTMVAIASVRQCQARRSQGLPTPRAPSCRSAASSETAASGTTTQPSQRTAHASAVMSALMSAQPNCAMNHALISPECSTTHA